MVEKEIQIINKLGLHARPATKLVRLASNGKSEVFLDKDGTRINARSILGVMLLQAEFGCTLKIQVVGEDEKIVLDNILELISNKFGED